MFSLLTSVRLLINCISTIFNNVLISLLRGGSLSAVFSED